MPNLFERSVIKLGNGGLAVVIPKSWAAAYNLQSGDVLRVRTNGMLVVEHEVIGKWKRGGVHKKQSGEG